MWRTYVVPAKHAGSFLQPLTCSRTPAREDGHVVLHWRIQTRARRVQDVEDRMIRKDPSLDTDKPHYYSQYWIDIATGKSTSSTELPQDEDVDFGDEFEPVAAVPQETRPAPRPKPPEKKQEQPRSLSSLADLANIDLLMNRSAEMDEDVTPDIASEAGATEPAAVSDYDASAEPDARADAEDELDDFDYDEEEEDDEWGESRRPKQGKPKRRERKTF
jgi:hypothetical protein